MDIFSFSCEIGTKWKGQWRRRWWGTVQWVTGWHPAPCFDWPSRADLVTGSLSGVLSLPRDVCVSACVIFAAPFTSDGFIRRSFVLGWHLQWGAPTGWQEIPGLRLSRLFKSAKSPTGRKSLLTVECKCNRCKNGLLIKANPDIRASSQIVATYCLLKDILIAWIHQGR